jgi:hypothetical protein
LRVAGAKRVLVAAVTQYFHPYLIFILSSSDDIVGAMVKKGISSAAATPLS